MRELIGAASSILPAQLSQWYRTHSRGQTRTHSRMKKNLQVTLTKVAEGGAADTVREVLDSLRSGGGAEGEES